MNVTDYQGIERAFEECSYTVTVHPLPESLAPDEEVHVVTLESHPPQVPAEIARALGHVGMLTGDAGLSVWRAPKLIYSDGQPGFANFKVAPLNAPGWHD